jgi:hypothetical protein
MTVMSGQFEAAINAAGLTEIAAPPRSWPPRSTTAASNQRPGGRERPGSSVGVECVGDLAERDQLAQLRCLIPISG